MFGFEQRLARVAAIVEMLGEAAFDNYADREPMKPPITAAIGFRRCSVGSACTPKFFIAVAPRR